MKVFENIEKLDAPDCEKQEIKMHISRLIELRKDSMGTENYVYKVLHSKKMREMLLTVIKDNTFGFGYLYQCLGVEQNQIYGDVRYNCVAHKTEVEYAVDFDIEDIIVQIENIVDLKDRLNFINKRIVESTMHAYTGELKDKFHQICSNYKQTIIDEIQLFGFNTNVAITNNSELQNKIDNEVGRLIPEYVSANQKKNLESLLNSKKTSEQINWYKSKDLLVITVCNWYNMGILQSIKGDSRLLFIMDNFKVKGKPIKEKPLRNSFSNTQNMT